MWLPFSFQASVVVERAIVFGNTATHLGKAAVEGSKTHSWTVYVRGMHGEDISAYVSKVVFKLHESFPNPTRGMSVSLCPCVCLYARLCACVCARACV